MKYEVEVEEWREILFSMPSDSRGADDKRSGVSALGFTGKNLKNWTGVGFNADAQLRRQAPPRESLGILVVPTRTVRAPRTDKSSMNNAAREIR